MKLSKKSTFTIVHHHRSRNYQACTGKVENGRMTSLWVRIISPSSYCLMSKSIDDRWLRLANLHPICFMLLHGQPVMNHSDEPRPGKKSKVRRFQSGPRWACWYAEATLALPMVSLKCLCLFVMTSKYDIWYGQWSRLIMINMKYDTDFGSTCLCQSLPPYDIIGHFRNLYTYLYTYDMHKTVISFNTGHLWLVISL